MSLGQFWVSWRNCVVQNMMNIGAELFKNFIQMKLFWQGKDCTRTLTHINEALIFEVGQLRHWVETIVLAHSQRHVLPPMTVSARRFEIILLWASQDVVKGPTKSSLLARCANSLGPIKYLLNRRFLYKHDVNVKRYWLNIIPTTACLLGWRLKNSQII